MVAFQLLHLIRKPRTGDAPRRRLHRSTYVVLLFVLAALVLANVPGQVELGEPTDNLGPWSLDAILYWRFDHGWPLVYLRRDTRGHPPSPSIVIVPDGNPWNLTHGVVALSPATLATNVLICSGMLFLAAVLFERWRRRRHRVWQFHVIDFAGLCVVVGVVCAWWVSRARESSEQQKLVRNIVATRVEAQWRPGGPSWMRYLTPTHRFGISMPPLAIDKESELGGTSRWLAPLDYLVGLTIDATPPEKLGELSDNRGTYDAALNSIAKFPRLESLSLGHLGCREWDVLRRCPGLRRLTLRMDSAVAVTDARRFSAIPTVETLSWRIYGLPVDGLALLSKLPNLKRLDLEFIRGAELRDGDVQCVSRLAALRVLKLLYARIGDQELRMLAGMSRLEALDLSGTQVSDTGVESLVSLPRLRELSLDSTAVTDRCIPTLARLPRLETLSIVADGLTDRGKAELKRLLPECDIVTDYWWEAPPVK